MLSVIIRPADQIARRAVVMASIAFRASLEVTAHRRALELSNAILPWHKTHGVDIELDPIERVLLETPVGQLEQEQQSDAFWAGEAAALFCWTLGLAKKPPRSAIAD